MAFYRITPDRDRPDGWQILSLLDIPVYVEPSFLYLLGFYFVMSAGSGGIDVPRVGLWCFVVFVSLLVHEFGHALTARAVGCRRLSISLWGGGGLARHSPTTTGRSLLIIGAGPGLGLLLGAICYLLYVNVPSVHSIGPPEAMGYFLAQMIFVNFFWNLFNLLPIYPMDGGQGLYHLLSYFTGDRKSMLFVARVSMVLCVIIIVWGVQSGYGFFVPMLCAYFFMANLQTSQQLG